MMYVAGGALVLYLNTMLIRFDYFFYEFNYLFLCIKSEDVERRSFLKV